MAEVLHMIQEIGQEVLAYADASRIKDSAIYVEMGNTDVEDALHKLFRHENAITARPQYESGVHSSLVRKMLEFADHPNVVTSTGANIAGTCFQAELRFARSLARNAGGSTPAPNRLPAAIICDEHATPFAYQKADGYPTAYAWRSATLATAQGQRWIPQGSIIELAYGNSHRNGVYAADPRHDYQGCGLVMLQDALTPDGAYLKRVGIEYMPEQLRAAAVDFAIADVPGLARYRGQAVGLTAESVEAHISALPLVGTKV